MDSIELNYKKPLRLIDLVHRELGEAPSEKASSIARILWRHGATVEKVNEALKVLEAEGKAEHLHPLKYEPCPEDPAWVGIFQDEAEWLDMVGGP